MGTAVKSQFHSAPVEEFVAYDQQGHSVVLRRNTAHPGSPEQAHAETPKPEQAETPAGGSLRFFADFHEVKALLGARGRR